MNASSTVTLLGGLGLFLLGIRHLTEGLKGLAGDSLRRALQRLVSGRFSAVVSGAFFTAVIQSSTAAILTVIGFVSAGLVNFVQAVGMIIGATLGTTSTLWLVAVFGLRFRISAAALPMLGVGAFLWLIARGKTRSFGALLADFGLIFTGIDFLQTGMGGVSWNLEAFAGHGFGARWDSRWDRGPHVDRHAKLDRRRCDDTCRAERGFADISARLRDDRRAEHRNRSDDRAGDGWGGLAVRRASLAHIIFSLIVGVLAILFLGPLTAAADWVGARLYDPDGVLTMATFSSLFKLAGIVVFYPWLDGFARFIVRISGKGSESAVSRPRSHPCRSGSGDRA
jgi:phosphate:Na+ symporter